jgi:hypothetical protein
MTDSADRTPTTATQPAVAAGGKARLDSPRTDPGVERDRVLQREKSEFSGMHFWLAFFGWLTATGMVVVLLALIAAIGALFGAQNLLGLQQGAQAVGIGGAIALLVVLLISYYCGGYVAGRMALFSGLRQGFAVWVWAIVMAIIGAIIAAVAGSQYNVLGNINSFPRIPVDEGSLTATGIVTVIIAAVLSLVGALLGGLAGMAYHRRVDRAGFDV